MFKKILGTGITRVMNLLIGFITMMMGTKVLGPAEWGIGFTVLTDVTFLLIGVEFLAGSGLVYFTPRKKLSTLMLLSYSWILMVMVVYVLLFLVLSRFPEVSDRVVPRGYEVLTLLLTLVYSFHNFNLNVFLGKEKVGTFDIILFNLALCFADLCPGDLDGFVHLRVSSARCPCVCLFPAVWVFGGFPRGLLPDDTHGEA